MAKRQGLAKAPGWVGHPQADACRKEEGKKGECPCVSGKKGERNVRTARSFFCSEWLVRRAGHPVFYFTREEGGEKAFNRARPFFLTTKNNEISLSRGGEEKGRNSNARSVAILRHLQFLAAKGKEFAPLCIRGGKNRVHRREKGKEIRFYF